MHILYFGRNAAGSRLRGGGRLSSAERCGPHEHCGWNADKSNWYPKSRAGFSEPAYNLVSVSLPKLKYGKNSKSKRLKPSSEKRWIEMQRRIFTQNPGVILSGVSLAKTFFLHGEEENSPRSCSPGGGR